MAQFTFLVILVKSLFVTVLIQCANRLMLASVSLAHQDDWAGRRAAAGLGSI